MIARWQTAQSSVLGLPTSEGLAVIASNFGQDGTPRGTTTSAPTGKARLRLMAIHAGFAPSKPRARSGAGSGMKACGSIPVGRSTSVGPATAGSPYSFSNRIGIPAPRLVAFSPFAETLKVTQSQ